MTQFSFINMLFLPNWLLYHNMGCISRIAQESGHEKGSGPAVVSKKGVEDGNQKRREGSSQPAKKSNPYIEKPFSDGLDSLDSW